MYSDQDFENFSLQSIVGTGPDAFGHMFDCYILLYDPNNQAESERLLNLLNIKGNDAENVYSGNTSNSDTTEDSYSLFGVNILSIKVPPRTLSTERIDYANMSIEIPGVNQIFDNTSEISFRLDENLYILNTMDFLSNTNAIYERKPISAVFSTMTRGANGVSSLRSRKCDIIVRRSCFHKPAFGIYEDYYIDDYTWTAPASKEQYEEMTDDTWQDGPTDQTKYQMSQYFIFDDVRFYGGEDLKLNRSSSEPLSMTYKFTFKNLRYQAGSA